MHDLTVIIIIITFSVIALLFLSFFIGWKAGYKSGQIDALGKDNIEWHLVEHNDGSKTWEKI